MCPLAFALELKLLNERVECKRYSQVWSLARSPGLKKQLVLLMLNSLCTSCGDASAGEGCEAAGQARAVKMLTSYFVLFCHSAVLPAQSARPLQ
jgi:hypothetical protein